MKGELKAIWSDLFMLEDYHPDETNDFSLWIELSIGVKGNGGADYFRILVCTPEWLVKHQWAPELMRHMLLVRKFDLDEITKIITDHIDKCDGETWEEIALKLSRVFAWEFEDYQP